MLETVIKGEGVRVTQAATQTMGDCTLIGFLCEASTGGTLTITDRSAGRTLLSAMALVAGQFYWLNVRAIGPVAVTIGGTGSGLLTFSPA